MHDHTITEKFALYNEDTIQVARRMPDNSVDFSVYSPPFASLFTYSASPRDLGNCKNDGEFFSHYDYLVEQQIRILKPGRLIAIHCMDMPTSKERDGYIGLRDFPGAILKAHEKHGFIYHSRVTVWKCPVTAVTRTKALGLLHKQLKKDSSMSRQGIADTIIVVRKPGTNETAISNTDDTFPIPLWQRYASPVWATVEGKDTEGFGVCTDAENPQDDSSGIDQQDTLNNYRHARENDDEKHLCPLQKGVIRRTVKLWSNPGELVWSPFAGVGSEGYVSLQMGRRFIGAELKESYYRTAVANLSEASVDRQASLFGAA